MFPQATCDDDDDGGVVDRQLLIPLRAVVEHLVTFVIKSSARLETCARGAPECWPSSFRVFLPFGQVSRAVSFFPFLSLSSPGHPISFLPLFSSVASRGKSPQCT